MFAYLPASSPVTFEPSLPNSLAKESEAAYSPSVYLIASAITDFPIPGSPTITNAFLTGPG
ncbi:MAG: hypothetical protein NZ954_08830 [Thermofilaceae archaeon]|nr:hypothetical protein [Thermofilaceae archaeon]